MIQELKRACTANRTPHYRNTLLLQKSAYDVSMGNMIPPPSVSDKRNMNAARPPCP